MDIVTNTPETTKKGNPVKGILFVFGAIVLIAAGAFGYMILQEQLAVDNNEEITETPTETLTVNSMSFELGGEKTEITTFQIKYNSRYFVTSDEMLTHYKTQGGSAEPRLVLTTEIQPLGTVGYAKLLSQKEGRCIVIQSGSGYDNIQEWLDLYGNSNPATVVSQEEITVGEYVFEKTILSSDAKSQNFVVAYLPLSDDYSYFFETNSTDAEKDLVFILNNFDLRGDIE